MGAAPRPRPPGGLAPEMGPPAEALRPMGTKEIPPERGAGLAWAEDPQVGSGGREFHETPDPQSVAVAGPPATLGPVGRLK